MEVEALSGVPQSVISRLERATISNPGIRIVRKLEAALQVTLLFGSDEPIT